MTHDMTPCCMPTREVVPLQSKYYCQGIPRSFICLVSRWCLPAGFVHTDLGFALLLMCSGVMTDGCGRRASAFSRGAPDPAAAISGVAADVESAAAASADVDTDADVAGAGDADKDEGSSTMRQGTSSRSMESDSAFMSSGISGMHRCAASSKK